MSEKNSRYDFFIFEHIKILL
ncbi:hypothetical protein KM92CIT3_40112 [uncultured Citrobacter sp.]|uniref:Uncharacterized protein n=1 Tax=uncultured Citrobacter sp. TaxID=200446 RepID=A0A212I7A1_9ENTR|nr:hypothetical protein KL86CIT2_250048 [uncultured Citrobacter sp.]SBV63836.1 hypothetical protein KM92CIT3_40112 [uncultured Citrobacter sp.]